MNAKKARKLSNEAEVIHITPEMIMTRIDRYARLGRREADVYFPATEPRAYYACKDFLEKEGYTVTLAYSDEVSIHIIIRW